MPIGDSPKEGKPEDTTQDNNKRDEVELLGARNWQIAARDKDC